LSSPSLVPVGLLSTYNVLRYTLAADVLLILMALPCSDCSSIAFLGYIGYCMSFENVLFVCLHVRLICALNYYLLTYLLTYLCELLFGTMYRMHQ